MTNTNNNYNKLTTYLTWKIIATISSESAGIHFLPTKYLMTEYILFYLLFVCVWNPVSHLTRTQIVVVTHKLLKKIILIKLWCNTWLEKLHNEKLHNLYSLHNTIRVIKTKRLRMEHTAHMGVKKSIGLKFWREETTEETWVYKNR
jgi:triacylglycerol esterase/lipase EstA (alpha/beta hydrolase family)